MFTLFSVFAFVVLYLLGVRFVGKPMAVYGWRFWMTKPRITPNVWSYLLYPVTHSMHNGKPLDQDRMFPTWHDDLRSTAHPTIVDMMYTVVETRKGYLRQFTHDALDRDWYIRHTAALWLPRLMLLAFVLHPYALLRHAYAAMRWVVRWVVNGGLLMAVVGRINL